MKTVTFCTTFNNSISFFADWTFQLCIKPTAARFPSKCDATFNQIRENLQKKIEVNVCFLISFHCINAIISGWLIKTIQPLQKKRTQQDYRIKWVKPWTVRINAVNTMDLRLFHSFLSKQIWCFRLLLSFCFSVEQKLQWMFRWHTSYMSWFIRFSVLFLFNHDRCSSSVVYRLL